MRPYSFQEYELITYPSKSSKMYNIFFLLIIIGIVYLICEFKFNVYEKVLILRKDDNYYLLADLKKDIDVYQESLLMINNKDYDYKILFDKQEFSNVDGTLYRIIPVEIYDYNQDNEYFYAYYRVKSNTIMNMIFEFTRGGSL